MDAVYYFYDSSPSRLLKNKEKASKLIDSYVYNDDKPLYQPNKIEKITPLFVNPLSMTVSHKSSLGSNDTLRETESNVSSRAYVTRQFSIVGSPLTKTRIISSRVLSEHFLEEQAQSIKQNSSIKKKKTLCSSYNPCELDDAFTGTTSENETKNILNDQTENVLSNKTESELSDKTESVFSIKTESELSIKTESELSERESVLSTTESTLSTTKDILKQADNLTEYNTYLKKKKKKKKFRTTQNNEYQYDDYDSSSERRQCKGLSNGKTEKHTLELKANKMICYHPYKEQYTYVNKLYVNPVEPCYQTKKKNDDSLDHNTFISNQYKLRYLNPMPVPITIFVPRPVLLPRIAIFSHKQNESLS